MAGTPDKSKYPPGVTSGNRQCLVRSGKTSCAKIKIPPFPIVSIPIPKNLFAASDWDVSTLINQTASSLCDVLTTQPPTASPTSISQFEGLDLYLFVDSSRSMIWRADVCRKAPGANPLASDKQVCWDLFLRFVTTLVQNATQIHYPLPQSPAFGWQANRTKINQGLRVWIYGFSCAEGYVFFL